jgi:hypothetical protein
MFGRRSVFVAVIALIATAAPASAATLRLEAPKVIDRAETFRLIASGAAAPQRSYFVSVIYHNDDQGRCGRTVHREVTRNEHAAVFMRRKVVTDAQGRFELSRKIFGGDRRTSGRFCGYLTNDDDENRDRVVRRIEFT